MKLGPPVWAATTGQAVHSGDAEKAQEQAARLGDLRQTYREYSSAAGLRTQDERIHVSGFGHREGASAARAARNADAETLRLRNLDASRRSRLLKNPELALPNAENAVIEQDKFLKYLFNEDNPIGYAKGVAFTRRLGYNVENWEELRDEIRNLAPYFPVREKGDTGHGMRYEQQMILYGKSGRPANVFAAWIGEGGIPRMTSVYIKEVKGRND